MGLLDTIRSRLASLGPDHGAMLAGLLPEPLVAHAIVTPAAFERGGGRGLLSAVADAASTALAQRAYVSGDPGSIGQSLPTTGEPRVMAVTATAVSVWDFGQMLHAPGDAPEYVLDRARIASVADTGKRAQGGQVVTRFAFDDGSSFDYRVARPSDAFWASLGVERRS